MRKSLLAFSGGLDSTLCLWELLTETDDEVHAFWMDLAAVEYDDPRARRGFYQDVSLAERNAVPKIVSRIGMRLHRNVYLQTIVTDNFGKWGWRVPNMIDEAAKIVRAKKLDRFIYGRSPENQRSAESKEREAWYKSYWAKIAPSGTTLEIPLIDSWRGRPHALAKLPLDVQALVVACNTPVVVGYKASNCGNCDKCTMTAEARSLLAEGMSPDVILDYHLKKRRAGPYVDFLVGDRAYGGGAARMPHNYNLGDA